MAADTSLRCNPPLGNAILIKGKAITEMHKEMIITRDGHFE